jgi:hypothetical protein
MMISQQHWCYVGNIEKGIFQITVLVNEWLTNRDSREGRRSRFWSGYLDGNVLVVAAQSWGSAVDILPPVRLPNR